MHYVPEGRNIGILVSAGSVLILLGCVLCQRRGGKRKECDEDEPSQMTLDETEENFVKEEIGKI